MAPSKRIISPTLRLGVTFYATIENGMVTSLLSEGDFLWGRSGRYPVSYFLLEACIINNVVGKDFSTALCKILEFNNSDLTTNGLEGLYETLRQELSSDIAEYLNLSYPSDRIQQAILEEVSLRYMDIQVHKPFSFVEGPCADEATIRKQMEALQSLGRMERMLSNNNK